METRAINFNFNKYIMNTKNKKANSFDIVIPIADIDSEQFKKVIKYVKKNIIGYRKIYLITTDPHITYKDCITYYEGKYPFSKKDIEKIFKIKTSRTGWYLQQLLKLYAFKVIPNIADNYLVIDSDTFFLKPTTFFEGSKPLFNYGSEYHQPYFEHIKRLHPSLERQIKDKSGICHHMMFNKDKLQELFKLIEGYHKKPFWKVLIQEVDKEHIEKSGMAEYEIYFNFLLRYHPNYLKIRALKWINLYELPMKIENYDYASIHYYLKKDLPFFKRYFRRVQRLIKMIFSKKSQ